MKIFNALGLALLAVATQEHEHKDAAECNRVGMEALKKEKPHYAEAIYEFTQAIEKNPKNAVYRYNRGACYYNLKQYDKCRTDFDRSLELDPKFAAAWAYRGTLHYVQQRWIECVRDTEEAIRLEPSWAPTYEKTLADARKRAAAKGTDWSDPRKLRAIPASAAGLRDAVAIAFSPDGKLLATSVDSVAKVWDPATGKELFGLSPHSESVNGLAFSQDGKWLAAGDQGNIRVWDLSTKREKWKEYAHYDDLLPMPVRFLSFSPDGKILASRGGYLLFRNAATGERIDHPLSGKTEIYAFTSDWKLAAAAEPGETDMLDQFPNILRIVDMKTGREIRSLSGQQRPSETAFTPDGKLLASSGPHDVRIWEVSTGKQLQVLIDGCVHRERECKDKRCKAFGGSLVFSLDGKWLAYAGHGKSRRGGGGVVLWDTASWRKVAEVGEVVSSSVAISPDGRMLATWGILQKEAVLWGAK